MIFLLFALLYLLCRIARLACREREREKPEKTHRCQLDRVMIDEKKDIKIRERKRENCCFFFC